MRKSELRRAVMVLNLSSIELNLSEIRAFSDETDRIALQWLRCWFTRRSKPAKTPSWRQGGFTRRHRHSCSSHADPANEDTPRNREPLAEENGNWLDGESTSPVR